MVREHIRCDAPRFTQEDYIYIVSLRDAKPKYKVVRYLMSEYKTSMKRIYQIWRGEEVFQN